MPALTSIYSATGTDVADDSSYASMPTSNQPPQVPSLGDATPKDSSTTSTIPPSTSSISLFIIQGIFLLILAVSGNFVAETMSCQAQKVLSENMFVKHGIIILITYFSLGFASAEGNLSPMEVFKQAVSIWVFFLMFNKMDLFFTAMVGSMLVILLVCKNYNTYYQKQDAKKNQDAIDKLIRAENYLFNGIILTTLVGFGLYFKKQHADHFGAFSYANFIFGTPKCDGL